MTLQIPAGNILAIGILISIYWIGTIFLTKKINMVEKRVSNTLQEQLNKLTN